MRAGKVRGSVDIDRYVFARLPRSTDDIEDLAMQWGLEHDSRARVALAHRLLADGRSRASLDDMEHEGPIQTEAERDASLNAFLARAEDTLREDDFRTLKRFVLKKHEAGWPTFGLNPLAWIKDEPPVRKVKVDPAAINSTWRTRSAENCGSRWCGLYLEQGTPWVEMAENCGSAWLGRMLFDPC